MKYNFGVIKNKQIGFNVIINGQNVKFSGLLLKVKQNKENIEFNFENGKIVLEENYFKHLLFRKVDDIYYFILDKENTKLSSFIGFTMFDTFGFPVEMTEEILKENGFDIDMEGFHLLRELQRGLSKNTFVNKNAF
jgi:alanyl-tRNA synthetase